MLQTRGAWSRRPAVGAFPGVETDVVMVSPCRQKRGLSSEPLGQLQPDDIPVEGERALEIGDLEMDMPDPKSWFNGKMRHEPGPQSTIQQAFRNAEIVTEGPEENGLSGAGCRD